VQCALVVHNCHATDVDVLQSHVSCDACDEALSPGTANRPCGLSSRNVQTIHVMRLNRTNCLILFSSHNYQTLKLETGTSSAVQHSCLRLDKHTLLSSMHLLILLRRLIHCNCVALCKPLLVTQHGYFV
jgi:hypothetical protein